MTDTITRLPPAPLYVLELWSNPQAAAAGIAAATGLALPPMGRAASHGAITALRFEPTVWLVEGDANALAGAVADDGALTAIGGGIVRFRLSGPHWRRLLMERGVFDAESPHFAPGCTAATVIDHVNIRLHVVSEGECIAFVPLSYAHDMAQFWAAAATSLD